MNHPFTLDISDLEAIELNFEYLTDEEATHVQGGLSLATTEAVGEEGGDVTTLALGEEGGDVTTLALGEEGGDIVCISAPCPGSESGDDPLPKKRPIKHPIREPKYTTLALGEEGGDFDIA
ncbi:MAG: hypothetical protein SAK29_39970 [Scytonema sp. PMC 1069.18]|nr:hypothetical protein [Scytonema sp. PMC 1069.18]MEC4882322.1 hypothetical protein [Scytonema sp. PMC 1070.18]